MTLYVGVYDPKGAITTRTLSRVALSMGARGFFSIGGGVMPPRENLAMFNFASMADARGYLPAYPWIAVETGPRAEPLHSFTHPADAIYLFGDQNGTIPRDVLRDMAGVVEVETEGPGILDVAVAGGIVLHDRLTKLSRVGL